jgi:hypothetical protein
MEYLWDKRDKTQPIDHGGSKQGYCCMQKNDDDNLEGASACESHSFAETVYGMIFKQELERRPILDRNALLFLRDILIYVELGASIKQGDIGRISNILQTITIMLQGTGRRCYSLELLRFTYLTRHAWSNEWRRAVLSSMLINTRGHKDRFIPADLYQEHNNCFAKSIYTPKNSNQCWNYLINPISPLLSTLADSKKSTEHQYRTAYNSNFHSKGKKSYCEILAIKLVFQQFSILSGSLERTVFDAATKMDDILDNGTTKLLDIHGLDTFLTIFDGDHGLLGDGYRYNYYDPLSENEDMEIEYDSSAESTDSEEEEEGEEGGEDDDEDGEEGEDDDEDLFELDD